MNYIVSLNDRAYDIHEWAKKQGFWDNSHLRVADPVTGDVEARPANPSLIPEKLCLIHSEVSEALEGWRDDDMENVAEELADIIIRVLDLSKYLDINIEQEIINKQRVNGERPHLHGRVR